MKNGKRHDVEIFKYMLKLFPCLVYKNSKNYKYCGLFLDLIIERGLFNIMWTYPQNLDLSTN